MSDMSSIIKLIENNSLLITEIGDCPNMEILTGGGKVFWTNVKCIKGWKLQYNAVTGLARILDENNIRKAWGSLEVMKEKFRRLTQKEFLEPGDVIGVLRKKALNMYEHYAVYLGDGQVIHYAGDGNDFNGQISVKKDSLEAFLKDDTDYFVLFFDKAYTTPRKIQVKTSFNMNDMNLEKKLVLQKSREAKLYSPRETIERAKSRIGEKQYNLLLNNCEHFAIWCKTGVSKSYQVDRAIGVIKSFSDIAKKQSPDYL